MYKRRGEIQTQCGQRDLPNIPELELASLRELEGEVEVVLVVSPGDEGELELLRSMSSLVLPGDLVRGLPMEEMMSESKEKSKDSNWTDSSQHSYLPRSLQLSSRPHSRPASAS